MKLYIQTQYKENYGAHNWDGEGECPQRWKFKGGIDYMIPLPFNKPSAGLMEYLINLAKAHVERKNYYVEEYVVETALVEDNYLTEYEQSQMRWEGLIWHPAKMLSLHELGVRA